MSDKMIKLSGEAAVRFNEQFIEDLTNGNEKEAAASLTAFTRDQLLENSFTEKVITPQDIDNTDLDKTEDPEHFVKWFDKEPESGPAVTIPLGTLPDGYIFKGRRYPVYTSRVASAMNKKDVSELRGYDYDIRAVMMEKDTKNIATQIDSAFIQKVNSACGALDTVNPLNGVGAIQYKTIGGGITRDSVVEAYKVIQRLRVPFGPMQPDGGKARGVVLANVTTAADLLKLAPGEIGYELSQKHYVDGQVGETLMGVKLVTTIKDDIIPDGEMYLFSDENFIGKYLRLVPLTAYVKTEFFWVNFMQWMEVGMTIGNVKGCARVKF